MAGKTWTPEEDRYILEQYETAPKKAICAALPHRKWESICARAHKLGVRRQTRRTRWTQARIDKLARLYPRASWQEILEAFPGVKMSTLHSAAQRYKLSRKSNDIRRNWTPEEEEILLTHYGQVADETMQAMLPARTVAAIRRKAVEMGISTSMWIPKTDSGISPAQHHQQLIDKYFGGHNGNNQQDHSHYLRAIQDGLVASVRRLRVERGSADGVQSPPMWLR